MNYWTQSTKNIYVAAHRGWRNKYPENTIEAFKAALTLDVDQLETDVRATKDGELVLIHDATVDRTTNGKGRVCDLTLAELRELDAGNGNKIPTLIELMELVKDHPTITLDVELKEYPIGEREEWAFDICDRVLKIIDDYGFTDRVVINSWDVVKPSLLKSLTINNGKYSSAFLSLSDPSSMVNCLRWFKLKP
jgi:glycerophosphoryl diester phosphodiesterase